MRTFGKIVLGILASLGLFMVVMFVGILYVVFNITSTEEGMKPAPDKIILSLDLDKGFTETVERNPLASFGIDRTPSMQDLVIALRRAKDDPRVVGLSANLSEPELGLAQIQEVRDLVADFRKSGKPTFLYSETMGETVGALTSYYLASSFGEIWVQPSGTVGVAGIGTEQLFFKKFLERFGLKGAFLQRKEYKSAGEPITNEHMSPANREATTALLSAWFDQMVNGISASRELTPDAVKAMIDKGPHLSTEARDAGLIDQIGYRDQFEAAQKEKLKDAAPLSLARYMNLGRPANAPDAKKRVAVIQAVGEIVRGGENEPEPLFGRGGGVRSGAMAKAIRDAVKKDDIAAILIRVDSPGGSYVASDTIWREVVRAREANKPVIVSMGDTAASGGYFIAMSADRIFAQPATVTGSIGVVMGKLVVGGAMEKYGVNHERITFGKSAGMFSATTDFAPEHLARLNEMLDATYADFTTKAAQGRGKSVEDLERFARGRVWSGVDALKAGLVDELGGYGQAIDYIKTRLGLQPADTVQLVAYPERDDGFFAILRALENPDLPFGMVALVRALGSWQQVIAPLLGEFQAAQRPGVQLYMPPVTVQ